MPTTPNVVQQFAGENKKSTVLMVRRWRRGARRSRGGAAIWMLSEFDEEEEVLLPGVTYARVEQKLGDGGKEMLTGVLRIPLKEVDIFELTLLSEDEVAEERKRKREEEAREGCGEPQRR